MSNPNFSDRFGETDSFTIPHSLLKQAQEVNKFNQARKAVRSKMHKAPHSGYKAVGVAGALTAQL